MMLTVCLRDIKDKKNKPTIFQISYDKITNTEFEQYNKSCQGIQVVYRFVLWVMLCYLFLQKYKDFIVKEAFTGQNKKFLQYKIWSSYRTEQKAITAQNIKLCKIRVMLFLYLFFDRYSNELFSLACIFTCSRVFIGLKLLSDLILWPRLQFNPWVSGQLGLVNCTLIDPINS